jgi:hypothetical protein
VAAQWLQALAELLAVAVACQQVKMRLEKVMLVKAVMV